MHKVIISPKLNHVVSLPGMKQEMRLNVQSICQVHLVKKFCPTKKPSMQYTGERRLVGIATMHKSNMVPFADEDDVNGSKAQLILHK